MCEIHFLMSIGSKIRAADMEEMVSLLKKGAESNKDGFGLFNDGCTILRNPAAYSKEFDDSLTQRFKGSAFIVAHNRLATHGHVKKRNTHPFSSHRLIWVHNGIISNYQAMAKAYGMGDLLVDSEVIGKTIEKELETGKDVPQAIKKVAEQLEGSYSVFLFHRQSVRLFYFRHDAKFTFRLYQHQGKKVIVGSSVKANLQDLYSQTAYGFEIPMSPMLAEKEPKAGVIYELDSAAGLREAGRFKPIESSFSFFSPNPYTDGFYEPYEPFEVKKVGQGRYKIIAEEKVLKRLREDYGHLFLDKQKAIISSDGLEELSEMLY